MRQSEHAWWTVLAGGAAGFAILWLEHRRPLRHPEEPQIPRMLRNLTLAHSRVP